jgi:hypothetical protein
VFIRTEFERLVRLVGANRTRNSQELIFRSGLDFDLDLMTTRDSPMGQPTFALGPSTSAGRKSRNQAESNKGQPDQAMVAALSPS